MILAELDEPGSHTIDAVLFPKVHFGDPPPPRQYLHRSLSGMTRHRCSDFLSDRHNLKGWIENPKIIRIGRDRPLTGSASADHNVSIHNIGRTTRSKQPPHIGGINPVQRYDIGRRLTKEPGQTRLPFRMADSLSESTRRNRDARPGLAGSGQQDQDSAVVPVNRDQRPGIHCHAPHYAAGLLARPLTPSASSAHRRSWCDSSPPVSPRASASMAPQPATSSRATPTACCTNPDTLEAVPASTRARMRST